LLNYFLKTDIQFNQTVTACLKQLKNSSSLSKQFSHAAHQIMEADVAKIMPCQIVNSRTYIIEYPALFDHSFYERILVKINNRHFDRDATSARLMWPILLLQEWAKTSLQISSMAF